MRKSVVNMNRDLAFYVLKFSFAFLMLFIISACGENKNDGQNSAFSDRALNGTYLYTPSRTATFTISNGRISDSYCNYDAEFSQPNKFGQFLLTVYDASAPGCLSITTSLPHDCFFAFNGDKLLLNCDDGSYKNTFERL